MKNKINIQLRQNPYRDEHEKREGESKKREAPPAKKDDSSGENARPKQEKKNITPLN